MKAAKPAISSSDVATIRSFERAVAGDRELAEELRGDVRGDIAIEELAVVELAPR